MTSRSFVCRNHVLKLQHDGKLFLLQLKTKAKPKPKTNATNQPNKQTKEQDIKHIGHDLYFVRSRTKL